MVHKKEGSWHACLDYRELNKITIKDKFSILVIDELLDELHEAVYLTKFDLPLGYQHIRMNKLDIPKLEFKTYEYCYEFLTMSFGLTDAPSTFHGLMNSISSPSLENLC